MIFVRVSIISIVFLSIFRSTFGKIYQRCELAKELRNFDVPESEIATWICIARYESNFDTGAMNPGSGDHGLFQISQLYWCSPPGDGYGCNSPCSKFRDDDISDDLQCIRRIHNEHKRISGNGFNAWVVYPLYCKENNDQYIRDCFDEESETNSTDVELSSNEVDDEFGDGYEFPKLPRFPKQENDIYEFPKLPFSDISIHRSIETKMDSERDSKVLKENIMLPFTKVSIHHSVAVEQMPFRKLPYSRTSIHFSIPVNQKLPFSKYSIDDFNPVNANSDEVSDKIDTSNESEETLSFTTTDVENESTFTTEAFITTNNIQQTTSTENVLVNDHKAPNATLEPLSTGIDNENLEDFSAIPFKRAYTTSKPVFGQVHTTDLSTANSNLISARVPTQKPSSRQVTFAPDSFFSWLFNSQTLPPLVAPARPSRPPGERPGILNERPRPPGLQMESPMIAAARPPRPRPPGLPMEPKPSRPFSMSNVQSTDLTTRRPFPMISRPNHPQRRPINAGFPPRRPNRPGSEPSVLIVSKNSDQIDKNANISGTPLQVAKRVQFNIFLRPVRNISSLESVINSLVPMFWVEESTTLPAKYAARIRNELFKSILIVDIIKYTILAIAIIIICACLLLFVYAN